MKSTWFQFGRSFLLAGLLVGLVDGVFLVLSRNMFFDFREAFRALLLTLGIDTGMGLVFGFFAAGIVAFATWIFTKLDWQDSLFWKTVSIAAALLGPAVFCLLRLTSGPKASQLHGRIAVVLCVGAAISVVAGFVISVVPRWISASATRRKIGAVLSVAIAVELSVLDASVLVRLYPVFHGALTVLTLLILGAGIAIGTLPPSTKKAMRILAGAYILVLGLGGYSYARVFQTQNIRFVIGYSTPAASDALALARVLISSEDDNGAADDSTSIDGPKAAGNALSLPEADVFLISVDAMRYDRLKALGAKRQVAPNIDRFAESAVVFRRAYTAIPHTSYALTSLLTGKYTYPLFDVPGAPSVHETWPEIMQRFRYETAAFFTPAIFFIDRARFEPYFRSGLGFSYRKVEAKHTAKERAATLTAYLAEKKDNKHPLFSWIHFFEPHEPYDPECTHFGTSPEDRYDCEIWSVDQAIGDLLPYIEKSYPNSVVIITADHGEEFGDHGGNYHGTSLYDEQVRVPLLMRIPGVSPRSVDAPVSQVDLLGTVLRIVDIPSPARIRSRDLTGVILNGDTNIDAFAEVHDESMVVFDGYKIICNIKSDLCRLYDLKKDPQETLSIAEQNPKRVEEMKKRLFAWRRSHARYELRPVSLDKGGEQWPDAVKRALGGDMNVLDDLLAVVSTFKESVIRRKAAELAFRLAEELPKNVPLKSDEADIEVSAWLNALLAKFNDKEAVKALFDIAKTLDPESDVFRTVALVRSSNGDKAAYDDLLTIALDDKAPIEERKQALQGIASVERRTSSERLIPLIDNYQLTLDAAKTLGELKIKAAVKPLSARLKRERFLERKAAIIAALSQIGDWSAVSAVSDELSDETPPPGTLVALSRMTDVSPFGRRFPSQKKRKETVFYRPAPVGQFSTYLKEIQRVVLRTTSAADGGTVVISCGGTDIGRIPLTTGSSEGFVDAAECKKKPGKPFELSLRIEAESNQASVDMVALLGK